MSTLSFESEDASLTPAQKCECFSDEPEARKSAAPAFWSRDSAIATPIRLDHPGQIAAMLRTRQELGLGGGGKFIHDFGD